MPNKCFTALNCEQTKKVFSIIALQMLITSKFVSEVNIQILEIVYLMK